MWFTILALLACTPAPEPPVPVPVAEAPTPPMAPPTGRAVVTTVRPMTYSGVAWAPAVERATEFARQSAHRCHADNPAYNGDLEVWISVNDEGRVTGVHAEPSDPPVVKCLKGAIMALRFPEASGEFPTLSVNASWRFGTAPIDLAHDCVEDRECGLVTGGCGGPAAVARREAEAVDAQHQQQLSVASCDGHLDPPSSARCVEGSCALVPADLVDLRGCTSDAGCAVIERWCGWDTVGTKSADEGRNIVKNELDAIPCDGPRGTPPAARCVYQHCTLDWAGKW